MARTWGSRCCAALRSSTASQDASRRSAENVGVEAAEEEGCASTTSEGDSLPEWLSLAPALPASASSRSGAAAGRVGAVARSREPSGLGAAEQRGRSDRTVGADWSCSSSDSSPACSAAWAVGASISMAWRWWEGLTRPCCGVLGPSIRGLRACSAGEWVGRCCSAGAGTRAGTQQLQRRLQAGQRALLTAAWAALQLGKLGSLSHPKWRGHDSHDTCRADM